MIIINKINYKLINFACIMIIFFFIIITKDVWISLFNILKDIIFPIFLAFAISYVLDPFVKLINNKTHNNNISVVIVINLVIIIFISLAYLSYSFLIEQVITLYDDIIPFFNNMINKIPWINYGDIEHLIIDRLDTFINNIIYNPINILANSLNFISKSIITIILTIYFLFNLDIIKIRIKELLFKNNKVFKIFKNIDIKLNSYLKSLFLIMLIEFFEYTIIYFVVGHPNFLLLGFFAGITSIIPYFGGLWTNVLALITAFNTSSLLFVICSFIVIICPIIDSYVIDPKIYQKEIKISPLKTIIAVIVFSSLFGTIGLIIAVPLYIIINEIILGYNSI